jgi:ketosteroid isomerase-like protein
MKEIESRLQYLEDRLALQDAFIDYLTAVDRITDVDALLACFTEDAVLDLRAVNMPKCDSHASIRKCYAEACADTEYLAHFVTNFRVLRLEGDEADCCANVMATSQSRSGREELLYVHYDISYVRSGKHWKSRAFMERPLMPLVHRSTAAGQKSDANKR